ncbi:MAG TPA: Ig-like domain-containing protein, partial [Myxococcota bacterium]|nr:Ig-like domain-containing protein [Myxococcota bacterium]
ADAGSVAEGQSTAIDVAANDGDPEGALNLGSIQVASGPAHGEVAVQGGGEVLYTHDGSETTADAFTYTIRDAANVPSNAASVSVTVTPVNDPPVAAPDSASVVEGGSVLIPLTANDLDAEGPLNLASIEIATQPSHGSVQIENGGSVTYTHDGGPSTSDSFSYTVRDADGAPSDAASVSISVTASPEVPALHALGALALASGLLGAARAGLRRRRR